MGNSYPCIVQSPFNEYRHWRLGTVRKWFDRCAELQAEFEGYGWLVSKETLSILCSTLEESNEKAEELWPLIAQIHDSTFHEPQFDMLEFLGAIVVVCAARTSLKVKQLYDMFDVHGRSFLEQSEVLHIFIKVSRGVSKFANIEPPPIKVLEALAHQVDTLLSATAAEQIAAVPIAAMYLDQFRPRSFASTKTSPFPVLPPVHQTPSPNSPEKITNGMLNIPKMPIVACKRLNATRIRESKKLTRSNSEPIFTTLPPFETLLRSPSNLKVIRPKMHLMRRERIIFGDVQLHAHNERLKHERRTQAASRQELADGNETSCMNGGRQMEAGSR
jgi:hypothetical protein